MEEERGAACVRIAPARRACATTHCSARGPRRAELEGRERGGHPERRQEIRLARAP
jgi:hypothetical protein